MLRQEVQPDAGPLAPPQVRRVRDRPIVDAGAAPGYGPIFNAGLLHHDGTYHLFTRAVRPGYRPGSAGQTRYVDYISDVVVFTSADGRDYDYGYVLAESGDSTGTRCFEDPRVQWVTSAGSDHLVMTYTDVPALESGLPWRIGARRLRWDGKRFELADPAAHLLGPSGRKNKDAVVFTLADGRVALIHRIDPDMQLAVFDDLEHLWNATDDDYWDAHLAELESHTLIKPGKGVHKVGGGAPPVLTDAGFLLFYHERRTDGTYTMNLALLDEKTGEVVSRLPKPLLEPELSWELKGDVNRVVFVQGAHVSGDEIYLTYGAADSCVGAAIGSVSQLLDALVKAPYDE